VADVTLPATFGTPPIDNIVHTDDGHHHAFALEALARRHGRIVVILHHARRRDDPREEFGHASGRSRLRAEGALLVEKVGEIGDVHHPEILPALNQGRRQDGLCITLTLTRAGQR